MQQTTADLDLLTALEALKDKAKAVSRRGQAYRGHREYRRDATTLIIRNPRRAKTAPTGP